MDLLLFSFLCSLCLFTRLFICALWSPAGKYFPIGILVQVRYLIVSIPDLRTLSYFKLVLPVSVMGLRSIVVP